MLTDIHLHVLPGVDDGPQDIASALAMLRLAAANGIVRVYATYHHRPGRWEPSPSEVASAHALLTAEAVGVGYPEIDIICEAYLSDQLPMLLKDGAISTTPNMAFLLELPFISAPILSNMVFQIRSLGFLPVICHPERVVTSDDDIESLKEAHRLGARIQLDAFSLAGTSGKHCMMAARSLLASGIVDHLASDSHSPDDGRIHNFVHFSHMYPQLCKGGGLE